MSTAYPTMKLDLSWLNRNLKIVRPTRCYPVVRGTRVEAAVKKLGLSGRLSLAGTTGSTLCNISQNRALRPDFGGTETAMA